MRIIHLHLVFGFLGAACVALLIQGLAERSAAERTNRMIAEPGPIGSADESPVATLARGIALARASDDKGAERAFQRVLQHGSPDLQRMASYNLGNLQLRQAMKLVSNDPHFLPQVELAKQQYRDLLAVEPEHWDARYNLERALHLVPESEGPTGQGVAAGRERAATTMMIEVGDLP